jgi:hypothetical protein
VSQVATDPASIAQLRAQIADAEQKSEQVNTALAQAEKDLERARKAHDEKAAAALRKQIMALEKQAGQLASQLASLGSALLNQGFEDLDDAAVDQLGADLPLALLPLRLETRFARGRSGTDLLIRIYPDQVHQDSHERELTAAEIEWGRHFWEQWWRAGGDAGAEGAAWAQLAARFAPGRAAWVARALRPENLADRPTQRIADSDPLHPEPQWPDVDERGSSWTRAPRARLLPDRFVAIGYRGGSRTFVHWGGAIANDPAVGPSPEAAALDYHGLTVDDDMLWILDFERALSIGMALRVERGQDLGKGVDLLLVLGVRASVDARAGQGLADLLCAHQYTDGFGLVAPATPTNNADGGTRSGYSARAAPLPAGWLSDDPAAAAPRRGSDGDLVAGALGLDGESLVDVDGADGSESAQAGLMHAVLWPGCGGYAVEQLFDGTLDSLERKALADHVERFVRPANPLPVLRIGSQPYGILPVAPPDTLLGPAPGAGIKLAVTLLEALRPFWLDSLPRVPRLPGADPDADLLAVLGADARSSSYAARPLLGPHYLDGLIALADPGGQAASRADLQGRSAALAALFARLGLTSTPLVTRAFYSESSALVRAPLVQQAPLSDTDPLADGYLEWLAKALFADVLAGHDAQAKPFGDRRQPLLWLVARAAVLELLADSAFAVLENETPSPVTAPDLLEPELVTPSVKTPLWRLRQPSPHGGGPLGEALWPEPDPALGQPAALLKRYGTKLRQLGRLPSTKLDRLFRDTLDLHAHRLDAWITSLATRRLATLRGKQGQGLHVGAFGWVEDLTPIEKPTTLPSKRAVTPKNPAGWVHTPSLGHANSAAILRSGELSHAGQGSGKLLGVDVSSRRVREVDLVLEGMRQGQSLGATLGYRFERELNDVTSPRLEGYLGPLRAFAPQTAGKLLPAASPVESGAARGVLDGMSLLRRRQQIAWGSDGLPARGSAEQLAIDELIDRLADLADAVSDLAIAESVYHAVQGNPLRAGASLEALDRGEAPPPELEFAHPRRSGVGVTHRVGILRTAMAAKIDPYAGHSGWAPPARTSANPRTLAEPVLSGICAEMLPKPGSVKFQAHYRSTDPHTSSLWETFTLEDLRVEPLDVVYSATPGGVAALGELEARAGDAARLAHPAFPGEITLVLDRDPIWGANVFTLPELSEIAAAIRALIVGARALDARDLDAPLAGVEAAVDSARLDSERVEPCVAALDAAIEALGNATDAAGLSGALLGLAAFGIPGAVPESEDETDLKAQADRVRDLATARKSAASDILSGLDTSAPDAAAKLTQALSELFGPAFRVLPPFDISPGVTFADSDQLLDGVPNALEDWLGRMGRVREGVARFGDALLHAAVGQPLARRRAAGQLVVSQKPAPEAGERWCGLPTKSGGPPLGGRLSLVFEGAKDVNLSKPVAGLFVDEWVEIVPNDRETTAVALGYNAPGSCAPQSILLGIPPLGAQSWSVAAVEAIVLEALELAKIRMVDPDSLGEIGHFMPALFFANNEQLETISTDLPRATAP